MELGELTINENGSAAFFAEYRARFTIDEPVPVDIGKDKIVGFYVYGKYKYRKY